MMADGSRPLIIGHRGACDHAPENTLASFRIAIDAGSDGIEMDVRLSKDGVPVVVHDKDLGRTAGLDICVADLTARQLGRVEVGKHFAADGGSADFASERIPTLAAALGSLRGFGGDIFIELKCDVGEADALSDAVAEVLKRFELGRQAIVKSFHLSVIPLIKHAVPDVRTAALFAPKIMTMLRKEKHLVSIAAEFGADELSIHYSLVTHKLMDRARKYGLPVNVWTVNHPRWVKRAAKLGIRSLITNDPAELIARRAALA